MSHPIIRNGLKMSPQKIPTNRLGLIFDNKFYIRYTKGRRRALPIGGGSLRWITRSNCPPVGSRGRLLLFVIINLKNQTDNADD